jgi:hypothetical protein
MEDRAMEQADLDSRPRSAEEQSRQSIVEFFSTHPTDVDWAGIAESRKRFRRRLVIIAIAVVFLAGLGLVGVAFRSGWFASEGSAVWTGPETALICGDVGDDERNHLLKAAAVMRQTSEGRHLFNEVVGNDVCVTTGSLGGYLGGITDLYYVGTEVQVRRIVIEEDLVGYLHDDELAAILVHEAAHAFRVFSGRSCAQTFECEVLSNGVAVEEEVSAHSAEARFWIEIHGENGTTTESSYLGTFGSSSENMLIAAYQKGTEEFTNWVREYRSDPRDGNGS